MQLQTWCVLVFCLFSHKPQNRMQVLCLYPNPDFQTATVTTAFWQTRKNYEVHNKQSNTEHKQSNKTRTTNKRTKTQQRQQQQTNRGFAKTRFIAFVLQAAPWLCTAFCWSFAGCWHWSVCLFLFCVVFSDLFVCLFCVHDKNDHTQRR